MRLFAGRWRGMYAGHRRGLYAMPIVKSHFFQLLLLVFNIFYPLHNFNTHSKSKLQLKINRKFHVATEIRSTFFGC
jgi:hypothetical protein